MNLFGRGAAVCVGRYVLSKSAKLHNLYGEKRKQRSTRGRRKWHRARFPTLTSCIANLREKNRKFPLKRSKRARWEGCCAMWTGETWVMSTKREIRYFLQTQRVENVQNMNTQKKLDQQPPSSRAQMAHLFEVKRRRRKISHLCECRLSS